MTQEQEQKLDELLAILRTRVVFSISADDLYDLAVARQTREEILKDGPIKRQPPNTGDKN